MTTAVATTHAPVDEGRLISVLESSLYPGAKRDSIALVIGYCKAQGLDPLQKPVHIVPMSVKNERGQYEFRDVIMPGIGLYRVQAARTGAFAGVDAGEFGPDIESQLGAVKLTHPEWCSVTVYRLVQGQRVGFSSGRVYWIETYATAGRDKAEPNSMWRKRARGQLEKCAEALALRRAFPELGGQPTAEELEGRVIDASTGEILSHGHSALDPEAEEKLIAALKGAKTIEELRLKTAEGLQAAAAAKDAEAHARIKAKATECAGKLPPKEPTESEHRAVDATLVDGAQEEPGANG